MHILAAAHTPNTIKFHITNLKKPNFISQIVVKTYPPKTLQSLVAYLLENKCYANLLLILKAFYLYFSLRLETV